MITVEQLKALNIPAVPQNKQVFRIESSGHPVIYFAKHGTWQHRGKTYSGTLETFKDWLKKAGKLG